MPSSSAAGLFYTLSDYLTQVRQLLRDPSASLYTDTDLTAFINRGLRQRDLDLGLNRVRYSFTLVASTFQYTFATVTSGGAVLSGSSAAIVQDVRSIIVVPLGGSSTSTTRYPLARWPYSRLAFLLGTAAPTYPAAYALYGATTVILAPPPAGAYYSEWDFVAYSADLVNPTDQDTQPYPYCDPVPYAAAITAKLQAQRYDEAEKMDVAYQRRLAFVRARSRGMAVSNPWSDLPMRGR